MASKLVLASVGLISFGRTAKGGKARIEFSFTKDCRKAMGWAEDPPDYQHGADLDGDLSVVVVTFTPAEKELARHATELKAQRLTNFVATRQELEGKRGKGHRWVVQADITFDDPTGCAKLERYQLTCGKSELRVSYEPKAVQEEIQLSEEQRQSVLPGND